jgi:hypothetical protein
VAGSAVCSAYSAASARECIVLSANRTPLRHPPAFPFFGGLSLHADAAAKPYMDIPWLPMLFLADEFSGISRAFIFIHSLFNSL